MDRTTHEIELPVGKAKVVLRDWLTGGEKRALAKQKDTDERQALLINTLVVSVAGKTENVIEAIDGLHGRDFDTILLAVAKVAEDSSIEKKTS